MRPHLALLVNLTAGRGRGGRWQAAVTERLQAAGYAVDTLVGATGAESLALARRAVAGDVGTLVALGGDGLVHLAVQAVAGTPVTLGVVPAGTGNDFARALGIPRGDPVAAAAVVAGGRAVSIDAGLVSRDGPGEPSWYAGVLASGFDSQVTERANAMRGRPGRSRYTVAMLAELRTLEPRPYEITVDDVRRTQEAVLVVVANTASYGAGMRIAPDATPTDGRLDVTIVGPVTRSELLRVFPRVYTGSFVRHPAVHRLRGRSVRLSAPDVVAYADGERVGPLPLTATAVPGALRVAVPAGTTARLRPGAGA